MRITQQAHIQDILSIANAFKKATDLFDLPVDRRKAWMKCFQRRTRPRHGMDRRSGSFPFALLVHKAIQRTSGRRCRNSAVNGRHLARESRVDISSLPQHCAEYCRRELGEPFEQVHEGLGAGHGAGGAYSVHNLLGQDPPDWNKEELKK